MSDGGWVFRRCVRVDRLHPQTRCSSRRRRRATTCIRSTAPSQSQTLRATSTQKPAKWAVPKRTRSSGKGNGRTREERPTFDERARTVLSRGVGGVGTGARGWRDGYNSGFETLWYWPHGSSAESRSRVLLNDDQAAIVPFLPSYEVKIDSPSSHSPRLLMASRRWRCSDSFQRCTSFAVAGVAMAFVNFTQNRLASHTVDRTCSSSSAE